MVTVLTRKHVLFLGLVLVTGQSFITPASFAAEETTDAEPPDTGMSIAIRVAALALGSALAIAAAGFATARVQAAVGAGGTGALAEKPEVFTSVLVLFAIPETIVVLGFVVALLLWTKI